MIVSLRALGRTLRPALQSPTAVTAFLCNHEAELDFRQIVREIVPDSFEEILAARQAGSNREHARVAAFLHRVEAELFPVYELEEYAQVAFGIPFIRFGWSYDRFHELDMPPGELLLCALCAHPFYPGNDIRIALLDEAEVHVPRALLTQIPTEGFTPAHLHERLDGTRYAGAAAFADWLWADTGTAFLDVDDEIEPTDADWTRENVSALATQWQQANAILDQVAELANWLETDPSTGFTQLLDAALDRDPHLAYERERRLYAYEITDGGLAAIPHDDGVTLPSRTAL